MAMPFTIRSVLNYLFVGLGACVFAFVFLYNPKTAMSAISPAPVPQKSKTPPANLETVTLGAGCFWCTQAVLERVNGVWEVTCGYMGGTVANPTYEQVCTGITGHAEVVQVKYDPKVLPFTDLLQWFWRLHDPTTLNRQGNDSGTQYRSVIFYTNEAQKLLAERSKADAQKNFKDPIVTQIVPAKEFYRAEDYHQEYFNNNANTNPYCPLVIAPKLEHLNLPQKPTTAPGLGASAPAAGSGTAAK
jgi:peptide-methionine (S)-S-oxide reductase